MSDATKLIVAVYGGAVASSLIVFGLRSMGSQFLLIVFVPLSFLFLMGALVYALTLAARGLFRDPNMRTPANIGAAVAGLIGLGAGGWLGVSFGVKVFPVLVHILCCPDMP
jgi:hypothetical protein